MPLLEGHGAAALIGIILVPALAGVLLVIGMI